MQGMKVVIVGGNGFLGKSITAMLKLRLQANVISLSRTSIPPLNIAQPPSQAIKDICSDASLFINCTGILYPTSQNTFDGVQLNGVKHLAALAHSANAHFIHMSAIGANATSTIPYARTKGLGELAALEICPKTTVFRPSIVFGPGDQFFNRFAELAKYMPFLPVFGDGSTKDISECVMKAIDNPACVGKIIELGGPRVYTYKELMQLTLDSAGLTRPILPLPWIVGAIQGFFLEKLPVNLFTVTGDQVKLLKSDNVVGKDAMTAADLGVTLTRAEDVLSTWMKK